jgi:hypothetical protein
MTCTLHRFPVVEFGYRTTHHFIEKHAEALQEAFCAVFGDELQDGAQEFSISFVGHKVVVVGCVYRHPNKRPE